MWIIELFVTFPSPILELHHALLPPKCCEPGSTPQTPFPSIVFTFELVVESIEELGGVLIIILFLGFYNVF